MPFWRTYYHLIWATKNRAPLIDVTIELRLQPYLVAKANEIGVRVYAPNGWTDHVHMIVSIPPKLAVADVVQRLKGASSFDLNQNMDGNQSFQWQRGYGVMTLGEGQRARAITCVEQLKEHHRQQTTNQWLERADEFDEGPPDPGPNRLSVPPMLKENNAGYEVALNATEFPF